MKLRSRLLTQFAGFSGSAAFKGLARSLSHAYVTDESQGISPLNPDAPPALYCLWHDAILLPLATLAVHQPARPICALVSRHQDGSYLAEFMKRLGVASVRGSTRRGGEEAIRQLLRAERSDIFITPDGPRGPRREVKLGILYLASQTGRPIIPLGTASSRGWRIQGKWTDLLVPRPFGSIVHYLGEPVYVAHGASRELLLNYKADLERKMLNCEHLAEQMIQRPGGWLPLTPDRKAA